MELIEHEVPPFELKLAIEEQWIERFLADFYPKSIVAGKTQLRPLAAPKLAFESDEILANISLDIEHPLNIGRITGQVDTTISFSKLADLERLSVSVKKLDWQKGPKFMMGSRFGFSVSNLAQSRIAALEKAIGPRMEKEIAKQFLEKTREHPFYLPFLKQQIPELELSLVADVKKLYYRIKSQKKLLQFSSYPILDLQIKDGEIATTNKTGPTLPGVGGGFIQFYVNLSQDFIQKEISAQIIGKSIAAGNKNVTIENVTIHLDNELIIAQVHFVNEEFPVISAELIPILDSGNQIINLDIKKLSMEKASWLLKGVFSLLKRSIENKIEKNLQFDISAMIKQRHDEFNAMVNDNLSAYDLMVQTFNPNAIVTRIYIIQEQLIIQGQIGGTVAITNKESVAA